MKIISKPKDYYDYLQGIYGIDEKIILDRTEFYSNQFIREEFRIIQLHVCDQYYEGIFLKGSFRYGKELESFQDSPNPAERYMYRRYFSSKKYYSIKDTSHLNSYKNILKKPEPSIINRKLECPIILEVGKESYIKFPILKEYDFHKVIPAEDMWLKLSDWLGYKPEIEDNRTDKEKILGKGFDIIHSFRNTK